VSRKHDAALVTLVAPAPTIGAKFFPGIVPTGTTLPYAVFDSRSGTDSVEREAGPAATQNPRWTIRCVGATVEQAKWATEQIKARLIQNGFGVVPTVVGERPGRFWFSNPIPVQRDDDTSPPRFYEVSECGFSSDPA
jgi:hypothetical protein